MILEEGTLEQIKHSALYGLEESVDLVVAKLESRGCLELVKSYRICEFTGAVIANFVWHKPEFWHGRIALHFETYTLNYPLPFTLQVSVRYRLQHTRESCYFEHTFGPSRPWRHRNKNE